MKIALIDTYYPDFLKSFPVDPSSTYDAELKRLMQFSFGTFDSYGRGLREHGHETLDIIANHHDLQRMWAKESGASCRPFTLEWQLEAFQPDVVFMQDLSVSLGFKPKILAGQCSCPMPSESKVKRFDVLFTSFPHYVPRFEAMGVKAVFNPLAFDPIVLERMGAVSGERSGCVFVGGVGKNSHWRYGTEVLETVAANIPEFSWYGYGVENLAADSPLRKCYKGQAWGLDMYRIMSKSAIVLNRHGEVAGDYANNMRLFEATGVGAMLLTDRKSNLGDYFQEDNASKELAAPVEAVSYSDSWDVVQLIRYYLKYPDEAKAISAAGQASTLRDHTYNIRMGKISDTLREML